MKLLRHLIAFREFILVFLLFITLERIVADKQLVNYINPDYNIFINLTLIILLIFAAFTMILASDRDVYEKPSGITNCIVFLIIIILMNLPHDNTIFYAHLQGEREFTLQTDVSDKSIVNNSRNDSDINKDRIPLPGKILNDTNPHGGIFKIEKDNFYSAAEDIFANSEKYLNRKLEVSGFVYKSKKLKVNRYIIARLVMYCCAADAGITGLIFNADNTGGSFKKDEWLELSGHIEMQNAGSAGKDEKAPVLVVESYKRIPPESNPYVYPVY